MWSKHSKNMRLDSQKKHKKTAKKGQKTPQKHLKKGGSKRREKKTSKNTKIRPSCTQNPSLIFRIKKSVQIRGVVFFHFLRFFHLFFVILVILPLFWP